MPIYEVKTKVFNSKTDKFIGYSTATVEADDKSDARFQFRHYTIELNTPPGLRIKGDLRTLKLEAPDKEEYSPENDFVYCLNCEKVCGIAEGGFSRELQAKQFVCATCGENICLICGCTDSAGCSIEGCYWVRPGLCSRCADGE